MKPLRNFFRNSWPIIALASLILVLAHLATLKHIDLPSVHRPPIHQLVPDTAEYRAFPNGLIRPNGDTAWNRKYKRIFKDY